MENEAKKNEAMTEETAAKQPEAQKTPSILDPDEQIRRFSRGKVILANPIRSEGKDVTELLFDFTALTGREYVEAMDMDTRNGNIFRISRTQALNLFAIAAGKATPGIDATDIRERMSLQDCIKAEQLSTIFYSACNRAGNKRISN